MFTNNVVQNRKTHTNSLRQDTSINTYGDLHRGSNPLPLDDTRNQSNNPQGYKKTTNSESTQYQYFEDSLTCCCLFGFLPEQAIKEFRDEFGKNPPPIYLRWWRDCWNEYGITSGVVRAWLEKCDRLGWCERLGIVTAQPIKGGAA